MLISRNLQNYIPESQQNILNYSQLAAKFIDAFSYFGSFYPNTVSRFPLDPLLADARYRCLHNINAEYAQICPWSNTRKGEETGGHERHVYKTSKI